jgi:uncharacterized repeat protein (TIGR03943 family)
LLGCVLAVRLSDGSVAFLVQSWYEPILVAAAVALLFLAAAVSIQALRVGGRWDLRTRPGGLVTASLVLLPIFLGLAMKPQPLASQSLGSGLSQDSLRQFSQSAANDDPARRNIYQWAYEFQSADPRTLAGQSVDVVGFVFHGKDDAPEHFQVARFVVACCVADATGHSLPVHWPGSATLQQDSWVHVVGHVVATPGGTAEIQATSVDLVEAPSNPYIYP